MQFRKLIQYSTLSLFSLPLIYISGTGSPSGYNPYHDPSGAYTIPLPEDTSKKDTSKLPYPFRDRITDIYSAPYHNNPMYLGDPSNVQSTIEYNPDERQYDITEKMGDQFFRNPNYMTFEEYKEDQFEKTTKKYWRERADGEDVISRKPLIPKIYVGSEVFDRIFGGNTIDIRPQGSAELTFGLNITRTDNPQIPEKQRRFANFDFNEKIQMNVIGNIGEKLKLTTNYNTEASFDFENQMKLEYTGNEDDIIRKIEAGNVTLPLNSTLIQGSQSLFGIKTQLQFGRLGVTTVFSQQKGQASTIEVPPGGGQVQNFEIEGDQYEADQHFFISQYFYDHYDEALAKLPLINSPIQITKLEVYVTQVNFNSTDVTRNVVAFQDLGEYNYFATQFVGQGSSVLPSDSLSNNLYSNLRTNYPITDIQTASAVLDPLATLYNFAPQQDYEIMSNAKKLGPNDFTFNDKLGTISLSQKLRNDQAVAVAFEYTVNGKVYRVGELTTSGYDPSKPLIIKLVRGRNYNTKLPTWKLMMKNVYSLGGYGIQKERFRFDVLYFDNASGNKLRQLPVGTEESRIFGQNIIRVLNLDQLNYQGDASLRGDGVFDYIENVTINSQNGRVIFPVREPFGDYLEKQFINPSTAKQYVFNELYDSTRTVALAQGKNKFTIKGSYQSSSGSEISLNAINIPQGSVKVYAGQQELVENTDYTVDYNLGRVKIINSGVLNSATPIRVSLESQSLFSIQSKTLIGSRFDYKFNKDFTVGGTILHLNERPITQKVNFGDEPISNTIWGFDGTYKTESRFITKMIDKLPLIDTKEKSSITVNGEFASLKPGHNKAIGSSGTAYIDDFEGTQSTIDIKTPQSWTLASIPRYQNALFPEFGYVSSIGDTLAYGYNRARLSWFNIDPTVFYRNPAVVTVSDDELSNHNVREIVEREIFPQRNFTNGQIPTLQTLNLAYYPDERGPYNFTTNAIPGGIFDGINSQGKLNSPQKSWAGIMRRLETNNFEEANVQYIQLWVMDPYNGDAPNNDFDNKGALYFNLGDISEDILRDGFEGYENGLPVNGNAQFRENAWGRTPVAQNVLYAFDRDETTRSQQDVGFDGQINDDEKTYRSNFLTAIRGIVSQNPNELNRLENDPSSDDFLYFRDNSYADTIPGILDRYKYYNGVENNSPVATSGTIQSNYQQPDAEDVNRVNGMEVDENYFQYKVDIDPTKMVVGQNYIADVFEANPTNIRNGTSKPVKWYLIKIPVNDKDREQFGQISDLKSVKFIRMFMKDFKDPIVLRFARLELLRGEWRKYDYNLQTNLADVTPDLFEVGAVSLEENGQRDPVNYVLPPGIDRQSNVTSTTEQLLNEQALSVRICQLQGNDYRAVYKNTKVDMRNYKRIQMNLHIEAFKNPPGTSTIPEDGDISLKVRLGTDFFDNYYEYDIPLKVTPSGVYDDTENNSGTGGRNLVWPDTLNITVEELTAAKLKRTNEYYANGKSFSEVYTYDAGRGRKIRIKGNPTFAEIRVMTIGALNNTNEGKCFEIWVNEFRMTDFEDKSGWAALARVSAKLADLGTVTVSGSHKTAGFGSIESKVSQRSQENTTQYDVATSLELGKFFPVSTGITIPMYYGFGEQFIKPEYDAIDTDIKYKTIQSDLENSEQRSKRRKLAQDYTRRRSLNFTNVKKNKVGKNAGKSKPWDVENFNFTYGFTEVFKRNLNLEYDIQRDYLAAVGYNFNTQPKGVTPFSKMKTKSKYAKPIKDFNFNLLPSTFSFRWDVNRHYGETQLRDIASDAYIEPTYFKTFFMNRQYGLSWDLTKSIRLEYNANNQSQIDEPDGKIDTEQKRDSIRKNFFALGRNVDYRQDGSVSYNLPLNKLPITDWINVTARYGFTYHWNAAPLTADFTTGNYYLNPAIGNTIQNSNTKQLNSSFAMTTLYNKWKFYKKITAPPKPKAPKPKVEPKAAAKDSLEKAANDTTKLKGVKPPVKKKETEYSPAFKTIAKIFFGLKNVSLNWSESNGLLLPGFTRQSELIGSNWDGKAAPGMGFTFGSQDQAIRQQAAQNGWLTTDTTFNQQFTATYTQNITGRASIEPVTGFRVDVNVSRNYALNTQENFRVTSAGKYNPFSHTEGGNFSISFMSLKTAFIKDRKDYSSKVFDDFAANRRIFSERLADGNSFSQGRDTAFYRDGYGATSQEVLILSFLSAYSGKNASTSSMDLFPKIPKPNWQVTYDGLSKLGFAKKLFQNVNLTHGYRSTYNVNTFTTDVSYIEGGDVRDAVSNFIPKRQIGQVSISEQFSPLIGIDITWNNNRGKGTAKKSDAGAAKGVSATRGGASGGGNLTTRIELKRDRNISLSLANIQVTEIKGTELVIGAGYRIPNAKLPIKFLQRLASKRPTDLNLQADFSIRKNTTILRKLVEGVNQPTAGLTVISIKTSADYTLNERLNLRIFFDKTINTPVVSTSFPSANTQAGISIRFTLSQ
ncbi:MAG TPA: cell surface protein SprA [Bacteroidia bacterium]|nr:cell surface protein SprA [Bacteroidia bacterium]HNU34570.1 cell surface protein SprA [Bacteroidia bacterium]